MEFPTLINWTSLFSFKWLVGVYFSFNSNFNINSEDVDKTPRFVASDLGLHCLPMSHKKGR